MSENLEKVLDTTIFQAALKMNEAAISSSSLIATWLAVIMGAFATIIAAGVVFVGVKYYRDEKALNKRIADEVALATMGFRNILDERIQREREFQNKEVSTLRSELSLVWVRNVVTSKEKDPHAIAKAIESAVESGSHNNALAMIHELAEYARKYPRAVGALYWNAMQFEAKITSAKEMPSLPLEALELITYYEEEIRKIRKGNPDGMPPFEKDENERAVG